ncbi:hypothetical protein C8J56DRAFT_980561 [Mycena floridula]|nr:hypothetical protein C8J56DRAFT_980561 [Mycena floridula]
MEVLLPVQKLSFPPLPLEIVFMIITAVSEIQPAKAVELAILSRDFQPFIECLLYHSVCLNSHRQINLFVDLVTSGSRPVSFYEERVRNLCVAYRIHSQSAHAILAVCSNLRTMAFYFIVNEDSDTEQDDIIALRSLLTTETIQPTRLAFQPRYLPIVHDLNLAVLQQVTHLELCPDGDDLDLTLNDTVLRHLPQLTHFSYTALSCSYDEAAPFAATLHPNDALRVCIIWINGSGLREKPYSKMQDEPRIVIGCTTNYKTDASAPRYLVLYRDILTSAIFGLDWGSRKVNDPDVWELAEEIVEKQRKSLQSGC